MFIYIKKNKKMLCIVMEYAEDGNYININYIR